MRATAVPTKMMLLQAAPGDYSLRISAGPDYIIDAQVIRDTPGSIYVTDLFFQRRYRTVAVARDGLPSDSTKTYELLSFMHNIIENAPLYAAAHERRATVLSVYNEMPPYTLKSPANPRSEMAHLVVDVSAQRKIADSHLHIFVSTLLVDRICSTNPPLPRQFHYILKLESTVDPPPWRRPAVAVEDKEEEEEAQAQAPAAADAPAAPFVKDPSRLLKWSSWR